MIGGGGDWGVGDGVDGVGRWRCGEFVMSRVSWGGK